MPSPRKLPSTNFETSKTPTSSRAPRRRPVWSPAQGRVPSPSSRAVEHASLPRWARVSPCASALPSWARRARHVQSSRSLLDVSSISCTAPLSDADAEEGKNGAPSGMERNVLGNVKRGPLTHSDYKTLFGTENKAGTFPTILKPPGWAESSADFHSSDLQAPLSSETEPPPDVSAVLRAPTTPADISRSLPVSASTPADISRSLPVSASTPADISRSLPVSATTPADISRSLPASVTTPADISRSLPASANAPADISRSLPASANTPAGVSISLPVSANTPLTEAVEFSTRPLSLPGLPLGDKARHLSCNGAYLAVKTATSTVRIWRLTDENLLQPLPALLLAHPRIECMTLQDGGGPLLATCATNIILWNMSDPAKTPVTLGEDFSGVGCCHLSSGDVEIGSATVLSLGVQQHVWVLDTVAVRRRMTLKGHESAVTCVHLEGTICAAGSEGGQLKVWETVGGSLLYSSHVIAPRPVSAVHIDSATWLVAAGCGAHVSVVGQTGGRWTQVATAGCGAHVSVVGQTGARWTQVATAGCGAHVSVVGQTGDRWTQVATAGLDRHPPADDCSGGGSQTECSVLSLLTVRRPSSSLFGPHRLLMAATTTGLVALNTRTWLTVYTGPEIGGEPWGGSSLALTPGGAVVACARSALTGDVTAVTWHVTSPDVEEQLSGLSIVCRSEIPSSSALRPHTARLPPRPTPAPSTRKVRSSGYGAAEPRRNMFQPRTNNAAKAKAASSRLSLSNLPSAGQRPVASPEPPAGHIVNYDCDVTTMAAAEPGRPLRILREGDTLLRIALSGNGRHLACSTRQGRSLEVGRLSGLEVHQHRFLMGTHGPVSSVAWSHTADTLVAVSAAGIHLWSFPSGDPLVKRASTTQLTFTVAQPFFMDEFVLAAAGESVLLYRLSRRDGQKIELRPALHCRMPCREVVHVAGAVQFRSSVGVACCSDHCLRLLDLHTGQVVATYRRAHRHPPHLCRLWEGSGRVPAALPLYDLIGSVSIADGVRLWDVRTHRLAQRLPAESMRSLPAGFQVSPCGRLLAVGGDSACVTLWDVRHARGPLLRMRTAAAGVSDVTFHPRQPALVAALLDGRLHTWPLV